MGWKIHSCSSGRLTVEKPIWLEPQPMSCSIWLRQNTDCTSGARHRQQPSPCSQQGSPGGRAPGTQVTSEAEHTHGARWLRPHHRPNRGWWDIGPIIFVDHFHWSIRKVQPTLRSWNNTIYWWYSIPFYTFCFVIVLGRVCVSVVMSKMGL